MHVLRGFYISNLSNNRTIIKKPNYTICDLNDIILGSPAIIATRCPPILQNRVRLGGDAMGSTPYFVITRYVFCGQKSIILWIRW